jgi:hypothetical protein
MNLDAHYQVLQPVPSGGTVRTLRARQVAGGREVMVHLFEDSGGAIERQVRDLPRAKREMILAQGLHSGAPCVVTELLPHGIMFEDWLKHGTLFQTGKWDSTKDPEAVDFAPTQVLPQVLPTEAPQTPVPAEPSDSTRIIKPSGGAEAPTQALPQNKPAAPLSSSMPTQAIPQAWTPASPPTPPKPVPPPYQPPPAKPAAPPQPAPKPRLTAPPAPKQANYLLPLVYALSATVVALLAVVIYLLRR